MSKKLVDVAAMLCLPVGLVSGLMLHVDVHHKLIYHNDLLWSIHEASGVLFFVMTTIHCLQHKHLFKHFRKIPNKKKRITTLLLAIFIILILTGLMLMLGCTSREISLLHYATALVFTLLALGHVAKRMKLFLGLK